MPWYVPMIPDADIVAFSGSVSNHWDRKWKADFVMSWTKTACWRSDSFWKGRSRLVSGRNGRGSFEAGSGGTIDRIGLVKRGLAALDWPDCSPATGLVV